MFIIALQRLLYRRYFHNFGDAALLFADILWRAAYKYPVLDIRFSALSRTDDCTHWNRRLVACFSSDVVDKS